jgi:hypothetical protein
MRIGNILKNSWKFLPGLSWINYSYPGGQEEKDSFALQMIKRSGHMIYLIGTATLIYLSINRGTLNPNRWNEISRERREYSTALQNAVACIEKDSIPGLKVREIADLYSKAGFSNIVIPIPFPETSFIIEPEKGLASMIYPNTHFFIPILTKSQLENVARNCEHYGSKN